MAQLSALREIGILIGSFIVGLLFFYVISPYSKDRKKYVMEQISSLLINMVIYVWISKILLNIDVFISDPLAILAYPSDSSAFYLASFVTALHVGWKVWRGKMQDIALLVAFVPIFLSASFTFEFIQMVWYQNSLSGIYLGLLMTLIIAFLLLQERVTGWKLSLGLMILWSLGQLVLSFILPFATVFEFIMAPWYLSILFLAFLGLYIFLYRKSVLS